MVVPIIFDTDMSIDTDDVGALCVAHALEDLGEARLLAVTHGTGLREALPAISAINRFYGRENDVPIGISSTEIGSPAATPAGRYGDEISWTNQGRGWYASTIARSFPSIYRAEPKRAAPSALRVLRTVLAAASEQSVTIVAVGHATNLVELLLSGPDDASPLSGYKLVELKVASMVWMGGSFLNSERVEWNFGACGASNGMCGAYDRVGALTARAVELWPPHVPITFVSFEVGEGVRAGGALYNGATNESPCRVAYNEFCGIVGYGGHLSEWCTRHGRAAWDLMAVLLAVRGAGDHYTLQPGYNAIDPAGSGRNRWWRGASHMGRLHYQAVLPDTDAARRSVADELDALLIKPPSREPRRILPPPPLPPPPSRPPSIPPAPTALSPDSDSAKGQQRGKQARSLPPPPPRTLAQTPPIPPPRLPRPLSPVENGAHAARSIPPHADGGGGVSDMMSYGVMGLVVLALLALARAASSHARRPAPTDESRRSWASTSSRVHAAAGRDEQRLALSSPGDSGDHGTGLARAAEGRAAAVSGDEYEVQRGREKPPRGPARSKMPSTFRWDDL